MTGTPEPIPFDELISACPTEDVDSAHRTDPYWFGLWVGGSQISWISREMADRREKAGIGRMYSADKRMTPEDGRRILLGRDAFRQRRLSALAAIGMWRTVSTEQIAALVGRPQLARYANDLRAGFCAGLLERGTFATSMVGTKNLPFSTLYRPIEGKAFHAFSDELSYAEWVAVTAGYKWERGSQYDRHNMLATEFALRVAEFCDVGNVVGEHLSSFGLLAPDKAVPFGSGNRSADLTVLRTDGLKIAVEITANTGSDFKKKVQKWVDMLGDIDPDEHSLSVVFVEAAGLDVDRDMHKSVLGRVADVVYEKTGAARLRIPERIAVASWREWFPAPNCASESFLMLRCQRPTGPPTARWEPVSLLDPRDMLFTPGDPHAATAALRNMNALWGTPHWLRDPGQAPDLTRTLFRKAGITKTPSPPKVARAS